MLQVELLQSCSTCTMYAGWARRFGKLPDRNFRLEDFVLRDFMSARRHQELASSDRFQQCFQQQGGAEGGI